jgi:predicted DCC family thiol-disulfide oxidoreductase YuxK
VTRVRATLLYDADCGFCRVCVAVILVWDRRRRLRPQAIQAPAGPLADMPPAQQLDSWHLVAADGERRSAGSAFPTLLALLPGGAPLAAVTARCPRATERAYRWVAAHRSVLGRALPAAARRWADRTIAARAAPPMGQASPVVGR